MLAKRVIPCLDVHGGHVTRGVQFGRAEAGELRNVGDPVELAVRYYEQGADEMAFFDITASAHGRATIVDVIERTADQCFMPLTVGGGIRTVDDMQTMLRAGADKVSINSSALATPDLIRAAGEIVLNSIDADGTKAGFDLVITRRISEAVGVPVVASGGAGTLEHMAEVLLAGKADAVLAASIFHFGTYTVGDVKKFLAEKNISVRL